MSRRRTLLITCKFFDYLITCCVTICQLYHFCDNKSTTDTIEEKESQKGRRSTEGIRLFFSSPAYEAGPRPSVWWPWNTVSKLVIYIVYDF